MTEPRFGDVYRWHKGKVDITVMVITRYQRSTSVYEVIHLVDKYGMKSHTVGSFGEYQLKHPDGVWECISG